VRLAWRTRTDDIVTGREVLSPICHLRQYKSSDAQLKTYQLAEPLLLLVLVGVGPPVQVILLLLQLGLAGLVLQPLEDLSIR
jgi:hypothetical protein